jgi:hypothetical protein
MPKRLLLQQKETTPAPKADKARPGVLADLDENVALVSLEILNASSKVDALSELLAKRSPVELEVA